MRRPLARAGLAVMLGTTALLLSGCGFLEPTRNTEGGITKPTTMPTIDAWVGDCFTFVENSNLAYVRVVPCGEEHSYIVMGRGSFTPAKLEKAGGRDAAVSAACDEIYEEFITAVEGRGKPEKQSIVATREKKNVLITHYSCVAADSIVVEATG